jgi:hypothetical protein
MNMGKNASGMTMDQAISFCDQEKASNLCTSLNGYSKLLSDRKKESRDA